MLFLGVVFFLLPGYLLPGIVWWIVRERDTGRKRESETETERDRERERERQR
jgi:hypothetical protein